MADPRRFQLRMRVLRLRMEYLALGHGGTREQEEAILKDLGAAVHELNAMGEPDAAERAASAAPAAEEAKPAASERRSKLRTPMVMPVVLRIQRADGRVLDDLGVTCDLSWDGAWPDGIQLVAPFETTPGARVTVDVGFPDGTRASGIGTEVRWCSPSRHRPGHYVTGLRVIDLSESLRDLMARQKN